MGRLFGWLETLLTPLLVEYPLPACGWEEKAGKAYHSSYLGAGTRFFIPPGEDFRDEGDTGVEGWLCF